MALTIQLGSNTGFIGNVLTITAMVGTFDSVPASNRVYFDEILAPEITIINSQNIQVVIPSNAVSSYIHVETPSDVSNYEYFTIVFEDVFFPEKKKTNNRFDFGVGIAPTYTTDYSMNNFSQIGDENNIVQNIYNILLTRPGERLFNPGFGCEIHNLIFNLVESDEEIEDQLLNMIDNSIDLYEPRAKLIKETSIVDFNSENGVVSILLTVEMPRGSVREVAIRIGASRNTVS